MAEPLAAAVHAVDRAPARALAPDAGVLGGGPMGQMLAALLVAEGRTVTLADRHPERRAQAEAAGALRAERLADHDVVFEAVGRPEAWRAAVEACAPGGCVGARRRLRRRQRRRAADRPAALRRGRRARRLPPRARARSTRALALLAAGAVDWRALAAGPIGLDDLPRALAAPAAARRASGSSSRSPVTPVGAVAALAGAPAQVLEDPPRVRDRLAPEDSSTGTSRWPVSASTSARRSAPRPRHGPPRASMPCRRSARATRPHGHSQSVGVRQR